jgi:hypothetical protein
MNRDIILVDQRGTGQSNGLNCDLLPRDAGLQGTLDGLFPIDGVRNCRTLLEKRADLNLYTTTVAMQDLDELREWLGYDWINIYGTRTDICCIRLLRNIGTCSDLI